MRYLLLAGGAALAGLLLVILWASAAPAASHSRAPGAVPTVLCGLPNFSRADYGTGGLAPNAVAPDDFNGDGFADLAVANNGTNTVSILLGNGDGTLRGPTPFPAGDYPRALVVGAFHGDNRSDLAALITSAYPTPADLALLRGNGDGTFSAPTPITVGGFPWCVAAADFNQDGKLDLVTGNYASNDVSVLLGNGDGAFGPPLRAPAGAAPFGIAVGDFNQDGKPDLAAAANYDSSVVILLGAGDGSFGPPRAFAGVPAPGAVVTADFNRDGKLDLALTTGFGGEDVVALLGDGTGDFGPVMHFAAGGDPMHLVTGDFNGDGNPDLAVANGSSNRVSVLQGDGNGGFAAPMDFGVFGWATAVAPADFNGDGRLDLAVANTDSASYTASYTVSILLNECFATVLPTATVPTSTPVPPTPLPPTGTTTPAPTTTPCALGFSDVRPADYFYTPVLYLACHGVISGYADGTFRPYNGATRGQMVKIVVNAFHVPGYAPPNSNTFADAPPSHPFFSAIEAAAHAQVVSGYRCGGPAEPCDPQNRPYFRPYAGVTRGQLSKIVVVAAGWTAINPVAGSFADVPPNTAFYPFVETASCHAITSGYACGGPGEPCDAQDRPYFRPYNSATRGQIAKIIYGAITNPAGACARLP